MKRPQQRRTTLCATDRQGSLLAQLQSRQLDQFAYTPFGHRPPGEGIGFNGEHPDPLTGHYLLGNGYRAYNPVLMRFNSPDSLSPFGKGGINAYAYCAGEPVNRGDSTGHLSSPHLLRMTIRPARPMSVALKRMPARPGKVVYMNGHVADVGNGVPWKTVPRAPRPLLEDMPPSIQEKILGYMAYNEPATVAQVSKAMNRHVMALSEAHFKRLAIADLPHQEWLGALDNIYLNGVPGVAPAYIRRHGLSHELIRQELIRAPRRVGARIIRYGEFPETLARRDAAQLQAMNGGGW